MILFHHHLDAYYITFEFVVRMWFECGSNTGMATEITKIEKVISNISLLAGEIRQTIKENSVKVLKKSDYSFLTDK